MGVERIWRKRGGLAWLLLPLAFLFWVVSTLRRHAYRVGLLNACRVDVPVVVVGNISVGGTGKTPLVGFFICLGMGFLFVELTLLSRFTLFLGHPVYAASATLGVFLLLAACGGPQAGDGRRRWARFSRANSRARRVGAGVDSLRTRRGQ